MILFLLTLTIKELKIISGCYIKENGGNRILLTSNKNRVYAHMLYKKFGFMEVDTVLLNKYI